MMEAIGMFNPEKLKTGEYVSQIMKHRDAENPFLVENLLVEYGAKAYMQARKDAADAIAKMFGS